MAKRCGRYYLDRCGNYIAALPGHFYCKKCLDLKAKGE